MRQINRNSRLFRFAFSFGGNPHKDEYSACDIAGACLMSILGWIIAAAFMAISYCLGFLWANHPNLDGGDSFVPIKSWPRVFGRRIVPIYSAAVIGTVWAVYKEWNQVETALIGLGTFIWWQRYAIAGIAIFIGILVVARCAKKFVRGTKLCPTFKAVGVLEHPLC